jgi:hypothetical protein
VWGSPIWCHKITWTEPACLRPLSGDLVTNSTGILCWNNTKWINIRTAYSRLVNGHSYVVKLYLGIILEWASYWSGHHIGVGIILELGCRKNTGKSSLQRSIPFRSLLFNKDNSSIYTALRRIQMYRTYYQVHYMGELHIIVLRPADVSQPTSTTVGLISFLWLVMLLMAMEFMYVLASRCFFRDLRIVFVIVIVSLLALSKSGYYKFTKHAEVAFNAKGCSTRVLLWWFVIH